MKININIDNSKKAYFLIVIMLVAAQILSKELNLVILIAILFYLILIKRNKIIIKFPGYQLYYTLLICGILVGIFNVIIDKNSIYNLIKHTYYILLPFLYWEIGIILTSSCKLDKRAVCNIIVCSTVIYVVYDWINIIGSLSTEIYNFSAYEFRSKISAGSYLPIIGFYIIYFYKDDVSLKKVYKTLLTYWFLITIIVHFSRTHLVVLCILILFSGLKTNFKRISKLIISMVAIFLIVGIIFPSIYSSFVSKINNSFNEISHSNDTWTHTDIVQKWRGYEMYCEIQQFEQANEFEKIFGGGFGRTLNVFGYAYLVSGEDSLLFLHNGYYTQLMVEGIFGVCMYIVWIITLYFTGKKQFNKSEGNLLKGIAISIFFTSYFVNGPFYSVSQAVFLFYFGIFMGLDYLERKNINEKNY